MTEKEIQENRTDYHRELRYWLGHIETWQTNLKRARSEKRREECQEQIVKGEREIAQCHEIWQDVTGLAPETVTLLDEAEVVNHG